MSSPAQNIDGLDIDGLDWIELPDHRSRIARTPVTNRQWKKFIDESGYVPGDEDHDGDYLRHWKDGQLPEDQLDKPVVFVSFINAWAFCDFYGFRLPPLKEVQTLDDPGIWEWYGDRSHLSCRGGSFNFVARITRCGCGDIVFYSPHDCRYNIGFRPVQDIAHQQTFPTQSPLESLIPWFGGVRPAHDIGYQQTPSTQPPLPWVGELYHDRTEGSDWGWIRDETGSLICCVQLPKGADLDEHRRNGTDPTQARVDALLKGETVHGPDMVLVPRALLEKLIEQSHSVYKTLAVLASKDGDK